LPIVLRQLSKNTVVIVTADHGESLGQHGLTYHGQALYWELIHVPIVIRYPGHVPTGVRVHVPVTSSALPATIMDLLGADGRKIFPGPPLNADPTPDAFDNIWVNDDIDPGVNSNARLEILVPGRPASQVELNIRVSDWNGQARVLMPYQMQLQEGAVPSETTTAVAQ
jgi:hypothetical protein